MSDEAVTYVRAEYVGGPRDGEWMPLRYPPPRVLAIPMVSLPSLLCDDPVPPNTSLPVGRYVCDSSRAYQLIRVAMWAIVQARYPDDLIEVAVRDAMPCLFRWEGAA